jgi:molecular chaperone DnaK
MEEFFGIDFGTTNSAVVGRLRRNVTPYDDGYGQPFPSLVAVNQTTGQVEAVGREAWNKRQQLAESCRILTSAKMQLGEGRSYRIGPETWTPERVVTEVLRGLKERVAARVEAANLEEPVFAIPVGFSPAKRKALRQAASEAGIRVRGFVSEPTAAVFRSFDEVRQWSHVVVFDWGGGTLDISVVSIKDDIVREIATVPKPLGGDNLDRLLAEWAHAQILKQKGTADMPFSGMDSQFRDALISQCETAKRMLADEDEFSISLLRYGEYGSVNLTITVAQFTRLMKPKIDEALEALSEGVINRARLSFDQVHILLVGGSSKLRGLRESMAKREWQFSLPEDSDWHTAEGAAILSSNFGAYISSQNIGLRLSDDTVFHMVREGDVIDNESSRMSFGLVEDTDHARLVVVESRNATAQETAGSQRSLDYISVPAYGFPNEPIVVDWHIDSDLLLNVTAQSERKGKRTKKRLTYDELRFSYQLPTNHQ